MPGWLKALLIVVVIIIVLVVGVVAAGMFWLYKNKDALVAKTKAISTEERDFGRNTDNQRCVDESISRYKAEPGFTTAISTSIFMRICMKESRTTTGVCDDDTTQTESIK